MSQPPLVGASLPKGDGEQKDRGTSFGSLQSLSEAERTHLCKQTALAPAAHRLQWGVGGPWWWWWWGVYEAKEETFLI